jgi:hypothetical protein
MVTRYFGEFFVRVIAEMVEPGVDGGNIVEGRAGVEVRVGTRVGVENVIGSGVFVTSGAWSAGAPHAIMVAASTSAKNACPLIIQVYRERNLLAMRMCHFDP